MTSKLKYLVASTSVPLVMLCTTPAFAAGTASGTGITNNVIVNYQVGNVTQTAATGSDTFSVDRKVIFTLLETGTLTTSVVPNQQDAVTTFTLNNTSNDTLDFLLSAGQLNATAAKHGGLDSFEVTGFTIFVDGNNNGTYEAGTDTATFVDDLAPDASIDIFIVGDIPVSLSNGSIAGVTLTATARNADGNAITAATDATPNTAGTETIFADSGRDGIESDSDDYTVVTAVLNVAKTSRVLWDPVTGSTNGTTRFAKAIPGAVVEYCIAVTNAGSAPAQSVVIGDALVGKPFAYYGTTVSSGPATIPTAVANPVSATSCDGTGTNADASALAYNSGPNTVSGNLGNIAESATETMIFRVVLN